MSRLRQPLGCNAPSFAGSIAGSIAGSLAGLGQITGASSTRAEHEAKGGVRGVKWFSRVSRVAMLQWTGANSDHRRRALYFRYESVQSVQTPDVIAVCVGPEITTYFLFFPFFIC